MWVLKHNEAALLLQGGFFFEQDPALQMLKAV